LTRTFVPTVCQLLTSKPHAAGTTGQGRRDERVCDVTADPGRGLAFQGGSVPPCRRTGPLASRSAVYPTPPALPEVVPPRTVRTAIRRQAVPLASRSPVCLQLGCARADVHSQWRSTPRPAPTRPAQPVKVVGKPHRQFRVGPWVASPRPLSPDVGSPTTAELYRAEMDSHAGEMGGGRTPWPREGGPQVTNITRGRVPRGTRTGRPVVVIEGPVMGLERRGRAGQVTLMPTRKGRS